MPKIKNLVIGAGLSGAVIAERIANVKKQPVLVIDAKNHIGGNCYDYRDRNEICIHKYGPHVFHTSDEKVWKYLSEFTKWHPFFLKVRTYVEGKSIPFSFNLNSIKECFPPVFADKISQKLIDIIGYGKRISILDLRKQEDRDLSFLADFIYNNCFLNYNKKQWGCKPEDLDPMVAARVPVSVTTNNNYFTDTYQAIPENGYTTMIENMLNNPLIEVRLDTKYEKDAFNAENIYYTGPIDEYFNYEFGQLPYRSLRFDIKEYDTEFYQENVVISYPNNFNYTRVCEHKYFLNDVSDKTVVSFEYPEKFVLGKNERYYPVPQKENEELYNRYLEKAKHIPNLHFLGRLGDYKYYNMDKAVARALQLFEEI